MENTTYLEHHGILGQKWGVRRYQNADGSYTESGKKKYISDKTAGIKKDIDSFKGHENGIQAKNGKTVLSKEDVAGIIKGLEQQKKKQEQKLSDKWDSKTASYKTKESPTKNMSDAELRQKINRIQMERQYSQLSKKDISAGQKFVSDVFTNAAKQTATNYASKYMTKGVDALIENVLKK